MSEPVEIVVGPPYVEITPLGRWWHQVTLHDSISWITTEHGSWYVFGRRWANNKADRVLAAHRRRQARGSEHWIVE